MKQTILGSGGAIGTELARALAPYTTDLRLVSRHPKKVSPADELFPADLTVRDEVFRAVAGSEIVYVTIGFAYNTKIWEKLWPSFMKNVIDACIEHQAKLVFFDNVYAIGGDNVKHITEDSPVSPCSRKGNVRAEVDRLILDAMNNRNLQAIIARAPDFLSVVKQNSMGMILIYDNLIKGKKAHWLCNAHKIHSLGYAPDLAVGTAMLGNTPDACNQIWNLPTCAEKITGEGWITLFAKAMNKPAGYQILPNWLIRILGFFIPVMKEIPEMNYQYDRDYFFDSSKFNTRFNFKPKTSEEAVSEIIMQLKNAR